MLEAYIFLLVKIYPWYIYIDNSHFYCQFKGGHLLLSNTGLLGIVCSCHCCHMSVLKFCEVNSIKTDTALLQ